MPAPRIKRTLAEVLAQCSAQMNRLYALEEKQPGAIAEAFGETEKAQVDTLISELNRIKRTANDYQVRRLLDEA